MKKEKSIIFSARGAAYGGPSLKLETMALAALVYWVFLIGAALGTQKLLGVSLASKDSSGFTEQEFRGERIKAGNPTQDFDALIDGRGSRVGELRYLRKTVSAEGTVKIPLSAPLHGASSALVLHNMGHEFEVVKGDLIYSGLTAEDQMIFPVGVVLYDYSKRDAAADPEHVRTTPSFFWRLAPYSEGCKNACAIYVEKPWAVATGREGSVRRAVSGWLGSWRLWDLTWGSGVLSLTLFASVFLIARRPRFGRSSPLRIP